MSPFRKRACQLIAALACAAGAGAQEAGPAEPGPPIWHSVAGGEVQLSWKMRAESFHADLGQRPLTCRLDEAGTSASCRVPDAIEPGLWPLDIEFGVDGGHRVTRLIVELRVPAIARASAFWASPGGPLELELEAPLPPVDGLAVVFAGNQGEIAVAPEQVRATQLRLRIPERGIPQSPSLWLRMGDMESAPFQGIFVSRWVGVLEAYRASFAPLLLLGALTAIVVVISQPARRARP